MLLQQTINIPIGAWFAFAGSLLLFLLAQLGSAIWFASKMNTKVGEMSRTLAGLEQDVRSLVTFDAKIQVLHERMNQSQQDRGQLWVAVNDLRRTMSSVQLRQSLSGDQA